MKVSSLLLGLLLTAASSATGGSHEEAALAYIRAIDLATEFRVTRDKVSNRIDENSQRLLYSTIVKNSSPAQELAKEFTTNLEDVADQEYNWKNSKVAILKR